MQQCPRRSVPLVLLCPFLCNYSNHCEFQKRLTKFYSFDDRRKKLLPRLTAIGLLLLLLLLNAHNV